MPKLNLTLTGPEYDALREALKDSLESCQRLRAASDSTAQVRADANKAVPVLKSLIEKVEE